MRQLLKIFSREKHAKMLLLAAERGDALELERILNDDPKCAQLCHPETLLSTAAEQGHSECVRLLIPYCGAKKAIHAALVDAAENGHCACVKILIPHCDPKADGSWALRAGAQYGHIRVVEMLLPFSDPKAAHSEALYLAAVNRHEHVVGLLWAVSDVPAVLEQLRAYDTPHALEPIEQRWTAEQQQHALREHIDPSPNTVPRARKI